MEWTDVYFLLFSRYPVLLRSLGMFLGPIVSLCATQIAIWQKKQKARIKPSSCRKKGDWVSIEVRLYAAKRQRLRVIQTCGAPADLLTFARAGSTECDP